MSPKPVPMALCGLLLAVSSPNAIAQQPAFSAGEKGIVIDAGPMGKFNIEPPILNGEKGEEKPVFTRKDSKSASAEYASGAKLDFAVKPSQLSIHFTGTQPKAKSFKFSMLIPMNYNQGGQYGFDAAPLKPLPFEKGGQFVQHGNATSFTVVDPTGLGFTIGTPGGYCGLQDNRAFGWAVFGYQYQFDIHGKPEGYINFTVRGLGAKAESIAGKPAEPKKLIADRFGQSVRRDYPGKVKSEEELKADGGKQLAEMAAYKPDPRLDTYGGLAGSGEKYGLKKTGFFHIQKAAGRDVMVSPEGNLFFQLGMCGIARTDDDTTVKGREQVYEWLPPKGASEFSTAWRDNRPEGGVMSFYIVNLIRKFGKPYNFDEWTGQVVHRLRSWGFNSAGAFGRYTDVMRSVNFPYVGFLPLGKGEGVQVLPDKLGAGELLDPFVPGTEEALEKKFAKGVAAKANDPLLIGYFLGNEQHFEMLPKLIPTYKASKVAAKGRLVRLLEEKYKTIEKFNAAWNPAKPFSSFDEIKEASLFVRTEAANADMLAFYELYLESYYSMVRRVFDKYDRNHLLIGSRWTPGTANNKQAVQIGSKYIDVVSINYYGYTIEHAFLKKVHEWSKGRPMIFSEWYYASTERGLSALVEVKDDKERGLAYRNYVEQAAALPFVVGIQWFIYADQALTGRFFQGFHGEGNNTGFVDVADRPYPELVAAAKTTNARIYDVMMGKEKAFAFQDSRFDGSGKRNNNKTVQVSRALPDMKLNGTTTNWPGTPAEPIESSRLVLGPPNPNLRGDYRLCWDEKYLYFHIQVKDPTPMMNKKSPGSYWAADCVELFIGGGEIEQGGNMIFSDRQILIGAGEKPAIHIADRADEAAECQVLGSKEVSGDGYVIQAAIPWKILGVKPEAGKELLFDVSIDNSDDGDFRKQQLAWNGSSQNSSDRGSWGRARLSDH